MTLGRSVLWFIIGSFGFASLSRSYMPTVAEYALLLKFSVHRGFQGGKATGGVIISAKPII
jgi:hypothetical protein